MTDVRLLLADDHRIVREGMKMIVESTPHYHVAAEASDGDELVQKAMTVRPDLIVSDLKMPGASIIDTASAIKEKLSTVKILIFTAYEEKDDIFRALDAGIDGYVMKDTLPDQILRTMDMVMMGYSCFQPKLKQRPQTTDDIPFTEREREVFQLVAENLNNQEIARKLYISEATVKTHISSILRKTGQTNRSQAVLYALKKGYVLGSQ